MFYSSELSPNVVTQAGLSEKDITGTRVLIVDDDPHIRLWLTQLLTHEGYQIIEAADGDAALTAVTHHKPAIMLLDLMMPGMDGFGVLKMLDLANQPDPLAVFVVTASADDALMDRAFDLGATDYFIKPMNHRVLLRRLQRVAQQKRLERLRDDLIQMIVHDMRNPLTVVQGYSANLIDDPDNPAAEQWLKRIYFGSSQLLEMVMMILHVGKYREGQLRLKPYPSKVATRLAEVVDMLTWFAAEKHVGLTLEAMQPEAQQLSADLDWGFVQRAVGNLVSNAIKHSPSAANNTGLSSTVQIRWDCQSGPDDTPRLIIQVIDQGEGISLSEQQRIFAKYAQVDSSLNDFNQGNLRAQTDIGIGLTFVRLVTDLHGGTISVESQLGHGATFTLVLPMSVE